MQIKTCPKCDHRFFLGENVNRVFCPICKAYIKQLSNYDITKPVKNKRQWPKWAKLIAKRKQEGEAGVGDTFARIASKFGGEQLKRFSKWLGMPCGCTQRQSEWNMLYAYDNPSDDA